jgi:2-succinyl-5-enolpyruvyl-6-hydroxy-3-cyclohexene-1-carboxylate synthase
VVIRFGGLPTSKPIWQWLSETEVPQVLVHHSRLTDPLGSANDVIDQHPVSVVSRLPEVSADRSYLTSWADADGVVRTVLERELAGTELSEPFVARATVEHAQPGSVVFVGSSMPIRDLDSYGIARREVTVIGNRGVNGIDGTISTALGCAIAGTPTTVLLGDIAALHDVSALAEVVTSAAPLRVVVINNDGGGIFSFLPQRQSGAIPHDVYEKHWGTPHGLSLSLIAEAMGLQAKTVMSVDALVEVLATHVRPELIEIHTERDANVERHRAIQIEVETALGSRQ